MHLSMFFHNSVLDKSNTVTQPRCQRSTVKEYSWIYHMNQLKQLISPKQSKTQHRWYSAITWGSCRVISPAIRLLGQRSTACSVNNKENSNAPHKCHLCEENLTMIGRSPQQRTNDSENFVRTSSWAEHISWNILHKTGIPIQWQHNQSRIPIYLI